jgi:hypothetical protein
VEADEVGRPAVLRARTRAISWSCCSERAAARCQSFCQHPLVSNTNTRAACTRTGEASDGDLVFVEIETIGEGFRLQVLLGQWRCEGPGRLLGWLRWLLGWLRGDAEHRYAA